MRAECLWDQMNLLEGRDFSLHLWDEIHSMDEREKIVHLKPPRHDRLEQGLFLIGDPSHLDAWASWEGHIISARFSEHAIHLFAPWVDKSFDHDLCMGGDIEIYGL